MRVGGTSPLYVWSFGNLWKNQQNIASQYLLLFSFLFLKIPIQRRAVCEQCGSSAAGDTGEMLITALITLFTRQYLIAAPVRALCLHLAYVLLDIYIEIPYYHR